MKHNEEIISAQIVLIPGVGLMPGLSNVFAFQASNKMQHIHSVNSFFSLLAASAWEKQQLYFK